MKSEKLVRGKVFEYIPLVVWSFFILTILCCSQIIEIQDRLIREGKLKSQGDIDKFREDAKDPVVLNSYLSKSSTKQGTASLGFHAVIYCVDYLWKYS